MGIPEVWIRDYVPFQSHLWNMLICCVAVVALHAA